MENRTSLRLLKNSGTLRNCAQQTEADYDASPFDHEERMIVCTQDKPTGDETGEVCQWKENRVIFTSVIHPDPVDSNWVPFMRECRERFAFRLFSPIFATPNSEYILNKNLKIISKLPQIMHWEQRLVWSDIDHKLLTLRLIQKRQVSNKFRTASVIQEKHLMFCCEFPFILDFFHHFQNTGWLFMTTEYLPGGSLSELVQKMGKVPYKQCQFYVAQVVLALEYLHAMGVIVRNLRLESICIGRDGYIKLVNMGNAVRITRRIQAWYDHYQPGTDNVIPQMGFRPPEIWLNQKYGTEVDWWTLGLLAYKLYSGKETFPEEPISQFYEDHMKRKIFDLNYDTPRWFGASDRKLFKDLLQIDPKTRLGAEPDGVLAIKIHPWFKGISWVGLYGGLEQAPFIPALPFPEQDPQDRFIKFEDDEGKIDGISNPLPFGYQFQNF